MALLRKALSKAYKPPIEQAIKLGMIAKCNALLEAKHEQTCYEAAWCLTNMAAFSTEAISIMRELGAHFKLVALMARSNDTLKEQVRTP